jgi:PPP family 3-phenylpropionic acid transporter
MIPKARHFPKLPVAAQYFLYFAVMGMYLPYFNLYCYHLGFSGYQIGVLSSLRAVTMVVFPMAWGLLADRVGGRRPIYIACNVASAALWALFLLTEDFAAMALITLAYGIFYSPLIAFLEALTMEVLGREKKTYGRVRVWGSVSFIAVVLVFGKLIGLFSARLVVVCILAVSLAQALIATTVPPARPGDRSLSLRQAQEFLRKPVLQFLACAFLMLVSHGAYYGFFSIHLETLGYSGTFIGASWALASAAEIVVMVFSGALFGRFPLERVLGLSFAAACLRWLILSFAVHPAVILAAQLLHALTYGAFHMASILYIDRLSPETAKTLGQSLNNALTYGLGLMVGFFLNGILYERIGSFGLFQASSLIAAAGGLLFYFFEAPRRKRQGIFDRKE